MHDFLNDANEKYLCKNKDLPIFRLERLIWKGVISTSVRHEKTKKGDLLGTANRFSMIGNF